MPSLNLDLDYPNHPKVKRLVGLLGRGADILPIRLWLYVGKYHAETGQLIGYSPQEIETQIEWWGKQGACVDALVKVVFLDLVEGGYQVHDWETHAGHIHALKIHAVNMNKKRWAKYRADPDGTPTGTPTRTPIRTPNKVVGNAGESLGEEESEGNRSGGVGDFDPSQLPKQSKDAKALLERLRKAVDPVLVWAEDAAKFPSTQSKLLARVKKWGEPAYSVALKKAFTDTGDRSIAMLLKAADKQFDGKQTENFSEERYAGIGKGDGSF